MPGPILTVLLTLASEQDTLVKGIALLAVYSLGLAVPFILTSLLAASWKAAIRGPKKSGC